HIVAQLRATVLCNSTFNANPLTYSQLSCNRTMASQEQRGQRQAVNINGINFHVPNKSTWQERLAGVRKSEKRTGATA
ncbi:unnamed protein product, partial [Callosobruchus maculatus]